MAVQDAGPRLLPIIGWLRTYDRRWLRGDLIAGATVAALIVPKNLGYAEIAGIPVQNGLYAAAAGAILMRSSAPAGKSRWVPAPLHADGGGGAGPEARAGPLVA